MIFLVWIVLACIICGMIKSLILHEELVLYKRRVIKATGSMPVQDCPLLDFYNELRHIYNIPDSVFLYAANDTTDCGLDIVEIAFAFINLLRRESAIFLFRNFAEVLSRNALKFVLAHEIGHVLDRKNNLWHFFLFPIFTDYNQNGRDFLADAFAAKAVGRLNAVLAFEELDELRKDKTHKTSMRIMALYMPTLFYTYA